MLLLVLEITLNECSLDTIRNVKNTRKAQDIIVLYIIVEIIKLDY